MKLSTRGRYGVRAMLELAKRQAGGPVPIKTLSKQQGISAKYLEQLLIPLKGAGLVKSSRGARGGYELSRGAEFITVYDIVHVLEGSLALTDCVDSPELCDRSSGCPVHRLWGQVSDQIVDTLRGVSLQQLAQDSPASLD